MTVMVVSAGAQRSKVAAAACKCSQPQSRRFSVRLAVDVKVPVGHVSLQGLLSRGTIRACAIRSNSCRLLVLGISVIRV